MFVADLDRPWIDTPFLLQGFLIEEAEQIQQIQRFCRHVMVDLERSTGDEYRAAEPITPARRAAPSREPALSLVDGPTAPPAAPARADAERPSFLPPGVRPVTYT